MPRETNEADIAANQTAVGVGTRFIQTSRPRARTGSKSDARANQLLVDIFFYHISLDTLLNEHDILEEISKHIEGLGWAITVTGYHRHLHTFAPAWVFSPPPCLPALFPSWSQSSTGCLISWALLNQEIGVQFSILTLSRTFKLSMDSPRIA